MQRQKLCLCLTNLDFWLRRLSGVQLLVPKAPDSDVCLHDVHAVCVRRTHVKPFSLVTNIQFSVSAKLSKRVVSHPRILVLKKWFDIAGNL